MTFLHRLAQSAIGRAAVTDRKEDRNDGCRSRVGSVVLVLVVVGRC